MSESSLPSSTPRVLLPVDLSACAITVCREAARVALAEGATVHLLHVVEPPDNVPLDLTVPRDGDCVSVEDLLRKGVEPHMETCRKLLVKAGVAVDSDIRFGHPQDVIAQLADGVGYSRVVMGSHGRSRLSRLFLGSVSLDVQRMIHVPVTIVPAAHSADCGAKDCAWCTSELPDTWSSVAVEGDG
jgi:nucleotide-binding universal stress UspA family protein